MRENDPLVMNVLSQNVLLNKTDVKLGKILAQDDRIDSIVATMEAFPGELDVVGVQEAHKSTRQHNGEYLAEALTQSPGGWVQHNQKPYPESPTGRAGEYVGLFGSAVGDDFETIELGDNRRAIMTEIAGVAFVNLHFRAGVKARQLRHKQANELVDAIADYDDAVVMGDFNEPPVPYVAKARDTLRSAGLVSSFDLTNQPHPITFPSPEYRKNTRAERLWSLDDILVRGERIQVLGAGVLERVVRIDEELDKNTPTSVPRTGSDHEGIWAKLAIDGR